MPASYPTSVKSFSSKLSGDLIALSHMTDLQDEVVAVETALLGTLAGPLSLAEGRFTLTSGTPVTTGDVSAAVTAYYTPYIGNGISLYDGSTAWAKYTFTEITISLVGLTASKPYDIFAYNSSGTVTIETLVWTNATTRATALAYQNGVLVKSGATTRRYLGTIYINSTGGQTDDTLAKRFVWNMYNRVRRPMKVFESTDTWTYNTDTLRQANGSTANQLAVVIGVNEDPVEVTLQAVARHSTGGPSLTVAIGVDSITTASGLVPRDVFGAGNVTGVAKVVVFPGIGFHYFAWLERGGGATTTFVGDEGGTDYDQSGLLGQVIG